MISDQAGGLDPRPQPERRRSLRRWLHPASYNFIVVFLAMGVFATMFAVNSYNLLQLGLANYRFVSKFGLVALMEGGLVQMLQLSFSGLVSLGFYLAFKACEIEMMIRWRGKTLMRPED